MKPMEMKLENYALVADDVYGPARIEVYKYHKYEYDIIMTDNSGTLEVIHYDGRPEIDGKLERIPEHSPCEVAKITDCNGNVFQVIMWKTWTIQDVLDAIVNMAGRHYREKLTIRDSEGFAVLRRRFVGGGPDVDARLVMRNVNRKDAIISTIQPVAAVAFDQIQISHFTHGLYMANTSLQVVSDANGFMIPLMPLYPVLSEIGCDRNAQMTAINLLGNCFIAKEDQNRRYGYHGEYVYGED